MIVETIFHYAVMGNGYALWVTTPPMTPAILSNVNKVKLPRHLHGSVLPMGQNKQDTRKGFVTTLCEETCLIGVCRGSIGFVRLPLSYPKSCKANTRGQGGFLIIYCITAFSTFRRQAPCGGRWDL